MIPRHRLCSIAAGACGTVALAAWAGVHQLVNDTSVRRRRTLAGPGDRVLAVIAHPDDEIAMAGTLATATGCGAQVTVLCLSRGEASQSAVLGGQVGAAAIGTQRLARARAAELAASCAHLGARPLQDIYPDGTLPGALERGSLTATVDEAVRRQRPSVLISLDDVIGLYGHPDHVASAQAVRRVLAGNPLDSPPAWYQVTLPARLVSLARTVSPVFARASSQAVPPAPTCAVRMSRAAARAKRAAVLAHRSQAPVLGDVQPGWNLLPHTLYYTLFDREYFSLQAR